MQRILSSGAWVSRVLLVCALSGAIHAVQAQQSWAAYVIADEAPVYADMSTASKVLTSLHKGDTVSVLFALQTSRASWCRIRLQSDQQDSGFVLCSQIHRGQAPSPGGGASGAPAPECNQVVERLMEASGQKAGLAVFSADFFDALGAGFRSAGREERGQVLAVMKREFGPSVLEGSIRRGLLNRCDPQTYAAVLDALKAPLAARMIKIEVESINPAKAAERRSYAARLRDNPLPTERVALLERLGRETGETEFQIDLMLDLVFTLASQLAGQTPSQAQMDATREQFAPQMRQILLLSFLVTYRSVSDDDINHYISLWQSQPLKGFNDTYRSVFQETLETQSRAAGAELRAYVDARRSRSIAH